MKAFCVYMLASGKNGTLYIGVTSDISRRVWEHKCAAVPGFTQKHGVKHLVWYEAHPSAEFAFRREKQLKKWQRAWKVRLIEGVNPGWKDIYGQMHP